MNNIDNEDKPNSIGSYIAIIIAVIGTGGLALPLLLFMLYSDMSRAKDKIQDTAKSVRSVASTMADNQRMLNERLKSEERSND